MYVFQSLLHFYMHYYVHFYGLNKTYIDYSICLQWKNTFLWTENLPPVGNKVISQCFLFSNPFSTIKLNFFPDQVVIPQVKSYSPTFCKFLLLWGKSYKLYSNMHLIYTMLLSLPLSAFQLLLFHKDSWICSFNYSRWLHTSKLLHSAFGFLHTSLNFACLHLLPFSAELNYPVLHLAKWAQAATPDAHHCPSRRYQSPGRDASNSSEYSVNLFPTKQVQESACAINKACMTTHGLDCWVLLWAFVFPNNVTATALFQVPCAQTSLISYKFIQEMALMNWSSTKMKIENKHTLSQTQHTCKGEFCPVKFQKPFPFQ